MSNVKKSLVIGVISGRIGIPRGFLMSTPVRNVGLSAK
jgi:hypothetical protein